MRLQWEDILVEMLFFLTNCLFVFLKSKLSSIKNTFTARNEVAAMQYFHKRVSRILSTGGCVGQGMCGRVCVARGDVHGRVWLWLGACMAGRHTWQGGGRAWQEKRQLQWAVRILLECILLQNMSLAYLLLNTDKNNYKLPTISNTFSSWVFLLCSPD